MQDLAEDAPKEPLGVRLRRLREGKGWALETLSHYSGVPWGTIKIIEEGRTKDPRLTTVVRLAWALGVTVDEFVGGIEHLWEVVSEERPGFEGPLVHPALRIRRSRGTTIASGTLPEQQGR